MLAWPAAPGGARLLAWHALRLSVLFAIWGARSSGNPTQCCPSAVSHNVVTALREEIALQFRRSRQRQYNLQFLPPRLLGTHRLRPADDGFAVWRDLGMCTVLSASSSTSPGEGRCWPLISWSCCSRTRTRCRSRSSLDCLVSPAGGGGREQGAGGSAWLWEWNSAHAGCLGPTCA